MRQKRVSDTLKRHRHTFHLARHRPDDWKEEKSTSFSESLHETRERAHIAEREAEIDKTLLKHSQQQVRLSTV
jgi:hypothetical protein